MQENSLEQRVRLGRLFDIYGKLLTEKQHRSMELYFCDDLSLGEIADQLAVSRQAIYDLIKRVEQQLERYESKLELLQRTEQDKQLLQEANSILTSYMQQQNSPALERIKEILTILSSESR